MTGLFEPYTKAFDTISLEDLNKYAALLDREENKYLVATDQFIKLMSDLKQAFYVLEIEKQTVFSYKSMYFDSTDLIGYTYHNQGRTKRRFKIRTREYIDSGLCFFEVKLKNKRGGTIKKRIPYTTDNYGAITNEALRFLRDTYESTYGQLFSYDISPQVEVSYSRITLVAKNSPERVTIDFNLSFSGHDKTTPVRPLIIVETKSSTGRGIADTIFRKHGIKSRSCSKYCLGANLLDHNVKYNNFKPLLKLYNNLPVYDPSA
jgi:hypothetical protein